MGSPISPLAPPPTSPSQLAPNKSPWYPRIDPKLSKETNDALRRAFDDIYQIVGGLLPFGVAAIGTKQIVIPAAVTNPPASIPGCQIKFTRAGLWLVTGVFSIQVLDDGDLALPINGSLLVSGLQTPRGQGVQPRATQNAQAVLQVQAQPEFVTIAQTWSFRALAGGTAQLQIVKDQTATGTHTLADGPNCSIQGVWCGL